MGESREATAYWTVSAGHGELRPELLCAPGPGEALVRAVHSGISRGTELLVVVADLARRSLTAALATLGIQVPDKM